MTLPSVPNLSDHIKKQLFPVVVAEPLRSRLDSDDPRPHHVIIELNRDFPGGLQKARAAVKAAIAEAVGERKGQALQRNAIENPSHPFLFAELTSAELLKVLAADGEIAKEVGNAREGADTAHRHDRAIFKVWESTPIRPLTTVSIRTVKADAGQTAFAASGEGIVWAILDSGIDATHPHFARYKNLEVLPAPLDHQKFVPSRDGHAFDPRQDEFGHGTHVAGIVAGASQQCAHIHDAPQTDHPQAAVQSVGSSGVSSEYHLNDVCGIKGMAPQCKVLSLRVLDDLGDGDTTAAINALEYVMQVNAGTSLLVHGVNMSVGYLPDPENYGSGQSPICRQVDRVVKSGVTVVEAAGNYGKADVSAVGRAGAITPFAAAQFGSIADPANAELAISVGSTHRERPHTYGISYFSSKGPTVDGRCKPDVVAPGERIISCATGAAKAFAETWFTQARTTPDGTVAPQPEFAYIEDSGTSMAAPHVSGVIAAFLSIRHEFIGEPDKVRELVIASAVDLERDPRLQGAGLVDLFHMIQST